MDADQPDELEWPRPPQQTQRQPFPLFATIAPMLGALVLWAVIRSPFALVFAALGPVIALAGLADSRRVGRRALRRERERFAAALEELRVRIDRRHRGERAALTERHPGAHEILASAGADPGRWACPQPTRVAVGTGVVPSALVAVIPAATADAGAPESAELNRVRAAAARLDDGPVVADAADGIGVIGPEPLAGAVARGIAVRLARQLPPDRWRIEAGETGEWIGPGAADGVRTAGGAAAGDAGRAWLASLPHSTGDPAPQRDPAGRPGDAGMRVLRFHGPDGQSAWLSVAGDAEHLPSGCATVIEVGGGRPARVAWHPDRGLRGALRVEAVTVQEAADWASGLSAEAERAGIRSAAAALPDRIGLAEVTGLLADDVGDADDAHDAENAGGAAVSGSGSLAAAFAVSAHRGGPRPLLLDLVADGPHAVIGGTTGTGKSELLIAWVVALAGRYPPDRLAFLLVDFKGGASFAPLARLPHTAGIITDLDATAALRALASLRAEVHHRERVLAEQGARDVAQVPQLARLVIVVDEFAAMLSEHPGLHALFADLAARGRALGIHLVLCTQRPAVAVRDGVLANADLRMTLRVNNRADSTAVIGTDEAAAIPATRRGRALVSIAGGDPVPVQVALATDADADAAIARWAGREPARRPWLEPLPALISPEQLPSAASGWAFGVLDRPELQRREAAVWDPGVHGHLLVLGAARSGCSTALATIADRAGARRLPTAAAPAWDAVADLLDREAPGVVAIDDLDALVARFGPDHRTEFVDRLIRLAREGPSRGLHLVSAMRRVPADLHVLAALLPARLLLRHAARQDYVLAGGDGADHEPGLPPGGGHWLGARVQVAFDPDAPTPADPPPRLLPLPPGRPLAVVTTRPGPVLRRLTDARFACRTPAESAVPPTASPSAPTTLSAPGAAAGATPGSEPTAAVVGDPDDWQAQWGALAALRPGSALVFDGCTPAQVRQLARIRELPPPLADGQCWLITEDGLAERTVLP